MNKKMRMFIIYIVFALIISCKNYSDSKQTIERKVKQGIEKGVEIGKEIKQGLEKQVKGFLDKEEGVISDDAIVHEIAKKLEEEVKEKKENKQEQEDKEELMQGDDPANIDQPSILQANNQDSTPALEAAQQITSGGQQKEEEKGKEEKEQAKAEKVKVKEEQKVVEQKEEQKVVEQKEEQAKAKAEQEKKEKEERERKDKEKQQQEQRKRQEEEKKKQEEQEKAKAEKERKEKEERQRQEQEERQIKSKIETLTKKIDEINRDIDSIKYKSWFVEDVKRATVRAQEVIDKVTGPIYDHFTDKSDAAIYYTWGLVDEDEDSELGDLLKKLSETRSNLRTKLNEGNQKPVFGRKEPELKENVNVSEIESDLDKLRSKLEEVKGYLKNESNFEKIKEYVYSSDY
ncbi:hypothetical protein QIA25_05750 (plasmid) [Borreliella spielmanii]|uniref:hypothetical protein n=1 Tax=Borreliella spielmanii TaxID=88916 RepID=UPI003AB7123A